MTFRIASTFNDSLAKLTGDEQKAAKNTAFDLQLDPSGSGMSFHKLDRAKDKRFWSVRVSRDLRIIVHKTEADLLLCFVGHHDDAYHWAERRKLETHPRTGAAQIVEIRETIQEIHVPVFRTVEREAASAQSPLLFEDRSEQELLDFGVPEEWLVDVQQATEDTLFDLAEHLPEEATEALLEWAAGGTPELPSREKAPAVPDDPFSHPDAQRRFRVMDNREELERALEFPWERWSVFLHPAQREVVERDYNGPARVAGSAGTGKTIVALHRAVFLARRDESVRVLLTTLSDPLARNLRSKLRRLLHNQPSLGERIDVAALPAVVPRLHRQRFGRKQIVSEMDLRGLLAEAAGAEEDHRFTKPFLRTEWDEVIDAWQIRDWDAYRDFKRLGRKTRLPESRREVLWRIFEKVQTELEEKALTTTGRMHHELGESLQDERNPPYDCIIVDEAQDLNVPQLRLLAAMGSAKSDSLFFAGDLGQRILQTAFSWKSLGVDIRGRSRILRVNYRTSHQIRSQADRLLDATLHDVDGNEEDRGGTVSVFNGPPPTVQVFDSPEKETEGVARWLEQCREEGIAPNETAIFVRSRNEWSRAKRTVESVGLEWATLENTDAPPPGNIGIGSMHTAKGLEFRAVAVMACDDEIIPSVLRIENTADDADMGEIYQTERHLLYVACTRARDRLIVTGVKPASEFLDDLMETGISDMR